MSIDSEVTSMTQNIQADYEGLENIGADLTGINKNILNIRTILDTIYNDMPKVTGEGTEVTLTPTRKGRLALIPKGNSIQESTTGKNILPAINLTSQSVHGVVFTPHYTNGLLDYVDVDGTWEGTGTNAHYDLGSVSFTGNESYSISGINGYETNYINLWTTSSIAFPQGNRLSTANGVVTRTALGNETCNISIYIYSGKSYDHLKVYPMICRNNTSDTYEPYTNGQAPNPSYPFPIKSVTGNNNVVVNSLNLMNTTTYTVSQGNLTVTRQNDGTFKLNGTYTGNTFIDFQNNIELNGDYTLFLIKTNTANAYLNIYSDNAYITANRISLVSGNNYKNFTYTGQCLSQRINIEPGTYNNDIVKIMLVKGTYSSLIDYVAYQNQTLPLNLGTIELNKIGNYQDYIYKTSGKNLLDKTLVTGNNPTTHVTQIDNGFRVSAESVGYAGVITVNVKQNTDYFLNYIMTVVSGTQKLVRVFAGTTQSTTLLNVGERGGTFNSGNNTQVNIWFYCSSGTSGIVDFTNVQLEEGTTATTYEPYGSGIWYKHEEIGKVVLNGTEEIKKNSTSADNWLYYYKQTQFNYASDIFSLCKCNYLSYVSGGASAITDKTANGFNGGISYSVIYFNIGSIVETNSVAGVQAVLTQLYNANRPLTFYLVYATPQDIEITDSTLISQLEKIEKMQGYNGTTIITSTFDSNNAQMIISASSLKGE